METRALCCSKALGNEMNGLPLYLVLNELLVLWCYRVQPSGRGWFQRGGMDFCILYSGLPDTRVTAWRSTTSNAPRCGNPPSASASVTFTDAGGLRYMQIVMVG